MNKRKAKSNLKLKELLTEVHTKMNSGQTLSEMKFGDICKAHRYTAFAQELLWDLGVQPFISDCYVGMVAKRIHDRTYGISEQKSQWEEWGDEEREAWCIDYLKKQGYTGKLEKERRIKDVVDL